MASGGRSRKQRRRPPTRNRVRAVDQPAPAATPPPRPWQVWASTILLLLVGLLALLQGTALVFALATWDGAGAGPTWFSLVAYVLAAFVGIGQAAAGVFLFADRARARPVVLGLCVAGMLLHGVLLLAGAQSVGLAGLFILVDAGVFAMLMDPKVAGWTRLR